MFNTSNKLISNGVIVKTVQLFSVDALILRVAKVGLQTSHDRKATLTDHVRERYDQNQVSKMTRFTEKGLLREREATEECNTFSKRHGPRVV